MSLDAYTLLGLTAVLAALVAVIVYALLRFGAAAREARALASPDRSEATFMADAVQEAMSRLRTQERESQARAEASERLSDQIVSSLTSGLLLVEVGGRVRLVNPAGRRLLDLSADHDDDYRRALAAVPPLRDVIAECLRTGVPVVRRTLDVRRGPRGVTHVGVTVSPVTDADGRLQSVICLFADLSAVMALEAQVRLKDSLASLGELTAGIAHEFRNGLATIHGYARLLDVEALPPKEATYVQGIRSETDALRDIVTNFLNFARPTPLTLTRVDLRTVIDRVVDEARPEAERQGGSVTVGGDFPVVEGDEVLLRQAFSNLCRNALEACAPLGRPPRVWIAGDAATDGSTRIVVADNGPGIDPAGFDGIFKPFVTTKAHGTGLGLALVQKIVVTHNGRVTASNRPDGGASFEVTLPLAQAPRVG